MSFHDIRFPTGIAYGAKGGPMRKTDIATLDSGFEERNTPWANSLHKYNIGYGVKTENDIYAVKEFFEGRRARLYAFRFKDFQDFRSSLPLSAPTYLDQIIGVADNTQTVFQLKKTYSAGLSPYARSITKPVTGTVLVGVNGTQVFTGFSCNYLTGEITFDTAPASGNITAGFEFDVPVRFDQDDLEINLTTFRLNQIPTINLLEVRQ